jgi:hypothetical protein
VEVVAGDDITAMGEYACGERRMAFRDAGKSACVRRGEHAAPWREEKKRGSLDDLLVL